MAEEDTTNKFNPANYFLILIFIVILAMAGLWWKDRNAGITGSAEDNLIIDMAHAPETLA